MSHASFAAPFDRPTRRRPLRQQRPTAAWERARWQRHADGTIASSHRAGGSDCWSHLLGAICAVALLSGSTAVAAGLRDNLIGYWPFDGSGADQSGFGRDLTLYGGVGFATGLFGQALDLHKNGNQYAARQVDDALYDFGSSDFTIRVWINFYDPQNFNQVFIEKFTAASGPGWTLEEDGTEQWHFYSNPSGTLYTPVVSIPKSVWHHVVLRRSGSTFSLFQNGLVVVSVSNAIPVPNTSMPLLIGKRNSDDGRDFSVDGRIDEVAIWNRALSSDEIAFLWNNGQGHAVPEPSTWILATIGATIIGLGTIRPRRPGLGSRTDAIPNAKPPSVPRTAWPLTLSLALSLMASASAAPRYHVTDLGDLPDGDDVSAAYAINAQGQVAGLSVAASGNRAFLWTGGSMQDLGDFPGGIDDSQARGINDQGQVVGSGFAEAGNRAFLWPGVGGMRNLGVLAGGTFSYAYDINGQQQVVGVSGITDGGVRGFLWTDGGGMQDLGVLPRYAFSDARAINENGSVVGICQDGSGSPRAFVWTSGGGMKDLGDLPGGNNESLAGGINDGGQIAGWSWATAGIHAVRWTSGGQMQDLGDLPGGDSFSEAVAINNGGQIVGFGTAEAGQRAIVWTSGEGMQDLNELVDASGTGWLLTDANAINDAGQIVGMGINPNGATHAYLLTPVPEPPSLALGTIALLVVAGAAWRRRQSRA